MEIQRIDPRAGTEWDAAVSGLEGFNVFHTGAWAAVLRETYGYTPHYLIAREALASDADPSIPFPLQPALQSGLTEDGSDGRGLGRGSAALPLLEVDSWLTGRRGICLPFTDSCPMLGDKDSQRELINEAIQLGEQRKWKYLEFRSDLSDLEHPKFNEPSIQFHRHTLNLSASADTLFNGFESSVRRAIRKAERAGVTIDKSNTLDALRTYYLLHCQTRQKHGIPPQPFRLFLNLHRHILSQGLGMVITARYQSKPIAAAVFLHKGAHSIYKFGASDPVFLELRANNLVMWKAIQWLSALGARILDFGRTSIGQEGLRRFKLGWGAEELAIGYHRYDISTAACVPSTDDSSGRHASVLRHVPLSILRLIGALLYKHVA
ncbi:MAG TPA: GNAT family N-acetyltransferase [Verrucomicrobiae bacterium]|nr:GNAT family N-acetyltransferase [Verrucomicrobiae bacterium]